MSSSDQASVNTSGTGESKKESIFRKLRENVDHVQSGISRLGVSVATTWNPNHRHDEEWEKEIDAKLEATRDSHRFRSFAPDRPGNLVKWHIDGHDYFWALSEIIDSATESIMILDWWLTPELYLRRPAAYFPEWRLDRLLKRKAEQGVKVFVQVYKEVTASMSLGSKHTKHALEDLHPNIAVMRHPDHSGGELVYYFSHHEKLCIVDNKVAAMGGLDACFGRWDTPNHPLADVHPAKFEDALFPGQDYNNSRIMDFQTVDKYTSNALAIQEAGRMPWHDTSLTFIGPCVVDLVQHFCERWNFVKDLKYKHDHRMEWLALPQPWESVYAKRQAEMMEKDSQLRDDHPHLHKWKELGRQFAHPYHWPPSDLPRASEPVPEGTCRVQVLRSAADWSHGILTEDSIQEAYISLIREANHCIYIENQFLLTFITTTRVGNPVKNLIGAALVERILSAAKDGRKFKIYVLIPEVPAFPGNIQTNSGLKAIMEAQYRSINRGGQSILERVKEEGVNPDDYISFWNLRSYDRINAPKETIREMEEKSGVEFHEAQVALSRVYVGDPGEKADDDAVVYIEKTHDQLTKGDNTNKKGKSAQDVVKLPRTVEEAKNIIRKFESAAVNNIGDVPDNVCQDALRSGVNVKTEAWAGTEQEELDSIVTEQCYIHTKLMIVDDRRIICGSANLNDRSQRGDHDSEIAIVIEDNDMIETTMNGKKYMAGKLAASWRRSLMREHLGLSAPLPPQLPTNQPNDNMKAAPVHNHYDFGSPDDLAVADPLSDEFVNLWNTTGKTNREIFEHIFRCVPTDKVRNWAQYGEYIRASGSIKTGHVAHAALSVQEVKNDLSKIRGHLVDMPIHFLEEEAYLTEGDFMSVNSVTLAIYI
ncbi:Phospholipase D1 [Vanrija pseudolonga]|uniref:Phospholipase n=1 Tax=Vanrija pseudolonga TaxID=143232 RepID=A0AAF0Y3T6_9TREE|nr:Phospholipase D1 [Vanrija pseudolonga]